jgi:hypothetical protein
MKRPTHKMIQNLFRPRFLKIHAATSKIRIQFQGDSRKETTAEAN